MQFKKTQLTAHAYGGFSIVGELIADGEDCDGDHCLLFLTPEGLVLVWESDSGMGIASLAREPERFVSVANNLPPHMRKACGVAGGELHGVQAVQS